MRRRVWVCCRKGVGGKMTKKGGKMTKMGGKSPHWSSGSSYQQVFCLLLLLMGTSVEILSESLSLLLLKEFKHTMMPYFCFDHCTALHNFTHRDSWYHMCKGLMRFDAHRL